MERESTKLRVAAAHVAPIFMNKQASLAKAIKLIETAATHEINYLVFPETFVPGYPYFIECYPPLKQIGALAEYGKQCGSWEDWGDLLGVMKACKTHQVAICLGISERVESGYTLFNSQVFIDRDGSILGIHRKLQPTYVERAVWAQGSGHTLKAYPSTLGRIAGLACWENTMNLARQSLIDQNQQIHAASWPALSTMSGFETAADSQIEALMKNHALTAQVFVICASNFVDHSCLKWMEENLGEQVLVKEGGGWSAVIHPFCAFLGGPQEGSDDMLVVGEVDLGDLGGVKAWIDAVGHYRRPEVLSSSLNTTAIWPDDGVAAGGVRYVDLDDVAT